MDKVMEKLNKLSLPATVLIASLILGGFFYASQVSKQKSIEKQQQIELQAKAEANKAQHEADQAKLEQDKREYIVKRKADCYGIEGTERKKFNNIDGSGYNEETDVCIVRYTTNEYKGVDCEKEYEPLSSLRFNCVLGIFTKEF